MNYMPAYHTTALNQFGAEIEDLSLDEFDIYMYILEAKLLNATPTDIANLKLPLLLTPRTPRVSIILRRLHAQGSRP